MIIGRKIRGGTTTMQKSSKGRFYYTITEEDIKKHIKNGGRISLSEDSTYKVYADYTYDSEMIVTDITFDKRDTPYVYKCMERYNNVNMGSVVEAFHKGLWSQNI